MPDESAPHDAALLKLHPTDNVYVLTRSIAAGRTLQTELGPMTFDQAIGLGHKIAACDLPAGTKVLKYGAPIGSMKRDAARGEHVHTHNLQSDYLPTFTLDGENAYLDAAGSHGKKPS